MKSKGKTIAGLFLSLMMCAVLCVFVGTKDTAKANADESETIISLTGLQMRGMSDNGWYQYIVLLSDAYSELTQVESIDATTLSSDKITLYMSAADTIGTKLSDLTVQHVDQHFWSTNGVFINTAEFNSTHGGHQVYKITVDKGCKLPYLKDGVVGTYTVDENYTFINAHYDDSNYKCSEEIWAGEKTKTVSLDGVQLRGEAGLPDNSWYHYLAVSSPTFSGMASSEDAIENGSFASTLNKITLYKVENGEFVSKTLDQLGANHSELNRWGTTALLYGFNDYKNGWDGVTVYKIAVEKGCELVVETSGSVKYKFIVDENYVFYNSDYGKESTDANRFGAFNWTSTASIPYKAEEQTVSVGDIQLRGIEGDDSRNHYLVIKSDAYNDLGESEEIADGLAVNDLSKITLYTVKDGALTGKTLAELGVNHIGRNKWSEKGAFIAFDEYKNGWDGSTVYKVVVEQGTKFVSELSADGIEKVFVVDKDYTFYNSDFGTASAKFGAFNWTDTASMPYKTVEENVSLEGAQLRGIPGDDSWYHYLVLLSSAYSNLGESEKIESGLEASDLSKITLYTVQNGVLTGKTLAELGANHIGRNKWGAKGAFIAFNEYKNGWDGSTVYKVVVEQGAKFVSELSADGIATVFVAEAEHTFYNSGFGSESAKFGALSWSDTAKIPYKAEEQTVSLDGIQLRGAADLPDNSWYHYLVIKSDAYNDLAETEEIVGGLTANDLTKIKLYTSDTDSYKTLAELGVNHIGRNLWKEKGAFIGFDMFKEGYNGKQVYKVVIEKGAKFTASVNNGVATVFVVDKDYTFFNLNYNVNGAEWGAFKWQDTPIPTSVENTGEIKVTGITNQSDGIQRWLILCFNDKFVGTHDVTYYDAMGYSNVLDNVLIYSGTDLSQTPVTLREIIKGAITIGQFGSPDRIGFEINNDSKFNGSNAYIVVIKAGCEMPYYKDGVFSKRTVTEDTTFINDNYGKTGEISGETGSDLRTYEDWSIEWSPAAFVTYKVVGAEKTFDKVCLTAGTVLDVDAFNIDGLYLSVTDNLGYAYYGQIITPDRDVEITLTYSTEKPADYVDDADENGNTVTEDNKGNKAVIIAVVCGVSVAVIAAAAVVALILKKKHKRG